MSIKTVFPSRRKKPVLVILHQEHSTSGRVGRLLVERGYALDIRRPRLGDPLPKTLVGHAGAVIFGGPMSVNDDEDFIRREIDWISIPLLENRPLLGICLGAQMMARKLGAPVFRHERGLCEIGYFPLVPTESGQALAQAAAAPWPGHVYHWHSEGFDCPAGATTLASGDTFTTQAFQIGDSAFGIQFHPEVTYAMMCRWTVVAAEKLAWPGAQDRKSQLDGRFQHDPQVARWLEGFLDHWLSCGAGEAG